MINLITPTGARPEAFALCAKWMARQDYTGPVRWVIVDDGEIEQGAPEILSWDIRYIRRRPYWREGINTQRWNMLTALAHIDPAHPLAIIEDDEHYRPGYLTHIAGLLNTHSMIGQNGSYKYNLRLMRHKKQKHEWASSLCTMAMRGSEIPVLKSVCEARAGLIDMTLWLRYRKTGYRYPEHMVTGIKCMPGRGGIDSGHMPNMQGYDDPAGDTLKRWIGKDADYYLHYAGNQLTG